MDSKNKFIEDLLERKILVKEYYFDFPYLRFRDDFKKFKRGTVIFGRERFILSYPKIGRIFVLEEGIKRHFREPFYVEEKADGYNIRVVCVEGKIYAITRGGFICPFTTDRLQDLANFEKFFEKYPDFIICGEIVGPDNPYMELSPPYIREDIAFLAFDIYNPEIENFLLPEEKYKILEETGIPCIRVLGKFTKDETEKVKEVVRKLNEQEIEGIVLKSSEKRAKSYKYSTPIINIKDIEADTELLLDLPGEFFTQRILRFVLSAIEFGIPIEEEIKKRIGEAFLEKFKKSVEKFLEKGKVSREYVLYFNHEENIHEFLKLERRASKHIKTELKSIERVGVRYRVTLEKVFLDSTAKLKRITKGNILYD